MTMEGVQILVIPKVETSPTNGFNFFPTQVDYRSLPPCPNSLEIEGQKSCENITFAQTSFARGNKKTNTLPTARCHTSSTYDQQGGYKIICLFKIHE